MEEKICSAEILEPFSIVIEGIALVYFNQYLNAAYHMGISDEMVSSPEYEKLYEIMMNKAALFSDALNRKTISEHKHL